MKFKIGVILLGILFYGLVFVMAISWIGEPSGPIYQGVEDDLPSISINLTEFVNFTEGELPLSFRFGIDANITSDLYGSRNPSFYDWISLSQNSGILTIDSVYDNRTGGFNISIDVYNNLSESAGAKIFKFFINATNDFPEFVGLLEEYELDHGQPFNLFLNGSDEENHFPLKFNLSFDSCELAVWSDREDCELFNLSNYSNNSALINFMPTYNDVGVYYVNFSISDSGENYVCPHNNCPENYSQNRTSYSELIRFEVFSSLEINASDCQNRIFQEEENLECQINVTTKKSSESISFQSNASVLNYSGLVEDRSWFLHSQNISSQNNSITIDVEIPLGKKQVGNWSINFSALDSEATQVFQEIIFYVNRTTNSAPSLTKPEDFNISSGLLKTIEIEAFDDDLLIPDKLQGFNESLIFSTNIYNASNLSQEISISDFSVSIIQMPEIVNGNLTNKTLAQIQFTPNQTIVGDYLVNISVQDIDGEVDYKNFNMSVIYNNPPLWNLSKNYMIEGVANKTLISTERILLDLVSEGYVIDDEEDSFTFSNGSNNMFHFNMTNLGVLNFTPYKEDVGIYYVNITVFDQLGLSNTTTFGFNITNINSDIFVLDVENYVANEGVPSYIFVDVADEDLRIRNSSSSFYELINFNWTITKDGNPSNLLNFSLWDRNEQANVSRYFAYILPEREDAGEYQIFINASDSFGVYSTYEFNLTINVIDYAPELYELQNQSSSVNRTLYYRINASHVDDGFSNQTGNNNFSFGYFVLIGGDIFSSSFNSTTGEINISFNDSQSGIYLLNVTVNATSTNKTSYRLLWIFVYDVPEIIFPEAEFNFSISEGASEIFNFSANHSVGDNLIYLIYLRDNLKLNSSNIANGSLIGLNFSTNFSEESYGDFVDLTLVVINSIFPDLNYSTVWNINVTHSNAPMTFYSTIGDKQANYNQQIQINLLSHFSDEDFTDVYYNQTVDFFAISNETSSKISWSLGEGLDLTFSASESARETFNITGYDYNSTSNLTFAYSNNFEVVFTAPSTIPSSSGGGGGGGSSNSCVSVWFAIVGICVDGFVNITNYDLNSCSANFTSLTSCDSLNELYIEKLLFTEQLIADNPECLEISENLEEAKQYAAQSDFVNALNKLNDAINSCIELVSQEHGAIFFSPSRGTEIFGAPEIFKWFSIALVASFVLGIVYYSYRRITINRILKEYQ